MFGSTTMEEPLLPTKSKSWAIFGFFGGVAATLSILAVVVVLVSHVQSSEGLTTGTVALAGEYGPGDVTEFADWQKWKKWAKYTPILGQETWCALKDFRNVALKTVLDATIFGLVKNINAEQKFEGSGVVKENNTFYVICDSSWSIPAFHDLSSSGSFDSIYEKDATDHQRWKGSNTNYLIPPADLDAFPHNVDSNWESITYYGAGKHHIVTQESLVLKDGKYHAVVMNIKLHHDPLQWTLEFACPSEFEFKDDSKGFEGMLGVDGIDGRFFLLGLCEGNYCDTAAKGKEPGNGRLVIMELDKGEGPPNTFKDGYLVETSTCKWKTLRVVELPKTADFVDYSDVARRGKTIAVTSQESSALLLADMTLTEDGLLDPDTFEVTGGVVTRFAPTSACQVQYCNVEGIEFMSDRLLVGASDSMKGNARQPFMCLEKDQSMHVFALPNKVKSNYEL